MTRVARVYETRGPEDGLRVLVDRLWPRGVRKDDPRIDAWWRELAPSTELRTWFAHRADRYEEFSVRYEEELEAPALAAALERARAAARAGTLTLLTATREMAITHANVLARVIDED